MYYVHPKGINHGVVHKDDLNRLSFVSPDGAGWNIFIEWRDRGNTPSAWPDAEAQTDEQLFLAKKSLQLRKMEWGKEAIAIIGALNDSLDLSDEDFATMIMDPTYALTRGLLETGGLEKAKILIENNDWPFWTESMVQRVVNHLNDFEE